jgi:hypothetical protein
LTCQVFKKGEKKDFASVIPDTGQAEEGRFQV